MCCLESCGIVGLKLLELGDVCASCHDFLVERLHADHGVVSFELHFFSAHGHTFLGRCGETCFAFGHQSRGGIEVAEPLLLRLETGEFGLSVFNLRGEQPFAFLFFGKGFG